MGKIQKITAVISIITVIILAVLLGIFLWKEQSGNNAVEAGQETTAEDEQQEADEPPMLDGQQGTGTQPMLDGQQEADEPPSTEDEQQGADEQQKIEDVTMVFTGDVLLGSNARNKYDSSGINGILSEYLRQEMVQADITMVNEEFPFSTRGTPMPDKQYTFRADPSYLTAFDEMGIDVVSLANNHALDYGTEALEDTFMALEEAGIPYVGAGATKERAEEAVFVECGTRTVGILSASRVIPVVSWNIENQQPGLFCTYDSTALVVAIEETKQQCDYVVVYVHWGIERQEYPEEYQRQLAQEYIDAGADLVIGSHPHVPQGIEYYQGKPIVYSLGNFIFNPEMAGTYMLKVVWDAAGESRLQVIPVAASNTLTSEMEGQKAEEMLKYIEEISYDISIDANGMVQ